MVSEHGSAISKRYQICCALPAIRASQPQYGAIVFNDGGYREMVASHRQAFVLVCSSKRSAS